MNLIDEHRPAAVRAMELLRDSESLNAEALRDLARVLLCSCTPYAGAHKAVWETLVEFNKAHEKEGGANG